MRRILRYAPIFLPFLLASLALLPGVAAADDNQEEAAVQAWGGAHADCAEWGDGCVVCRREPGTNACSTPGIACMPNTTICRRNIEPTASKGI